MNDIPSHDDPPDVDEQYRRASERDASGPSEAVGRAVLARAAALAAERAAVVHSARPLSARPRWWRAAGLAAAAAIVGFVVWPRMDRAPPATKELARQSVDMPRYAAPAAAPTVQELAPVAGKKTTAPSVARAAARATPSRAASPPSVPAIVASSPPRSRLSTPQTSREAQEPAMSGGLTEASVNKLAAADGAVSAAAAPPVAAQSLAKAAPLYSEADLRRAAELGDVAALQSILGAHADQPLDLNARDANGRTAILLATMTGAAPAVEFLLAHGADPSIADGSGKSPLQVAIADQRADIAAALRLAGAR
jgi:hypothetical protein